jgi:hypothetical protein
VFPPLLVQILGPKLGNAVRPDLETVIMNQRLATIAVLCREVALPASVLACIAASSFAGIDSTGAAPIIDHLAQSLTADAKFADKLQPTKLVVAAVVTATAPATEVATTEVATTSTPPTAHEPEPVVTGALTDSSQSLRAETPPKPEAKVTVAALEPDDASPSAGSIEAHDECLVPDSCVDRYLWTLYQRTPKEDAVTTRERKQVTVKKKGKLVTVTKTFTTAADEDFSWKDPKAAEKVGMTLMDYVIGGMDGDFKLKIFHLLHAAEAAGLSPGITSAFRDDYRQSIANGLKAADNRSYHGGSLRGGYGHGLAVDIVSVNGATRAERLAASQTLWKWVDAHGQDFDLGRPYLGRDPPHVAPIDGQEFATHRPGMKARQAALAAKPPKNLALGDDRGTAKRAKAQRSTRMSAI